MNCLTFLLAVHSDLPLKRKSQNPTSEVTKAFRVGMRTPNTEAVNIRLQFFLVKTQIRIIFFQQLIFIWTSSSLNLDTDMWKYQRSISPAYKQHKKFKSIKKVIDTEITWGDGGSQGGPSDPASWACNSWNPFWVNPCGFGCYVLLTHRILWKWWDVTFENKLRKDGSVWAEVIKKTVTYVWGSSLSLTLVMLWGQAALGSGTRPVSNQEKALARESSSHRSRPQRTQPQPVAGPVSRGAAYQGHLAE